MSASFKFSMYPWSFVLLALTVIVLIITGQSNAWSVNNSKRDAAIKIGNFDNYANLQSLRFDQKGNEQIQNSGNSSIFDLENKTQFINSLLSPAVSGSEFNSGLFFEESREITQKAINSADCTTT